MNCQALQAEAGVPCNRALDFVAHLRKDFADALDLIALNLDLVIFARTAGTASVFQTGQQCGQVAFVSTQAGNDGHMFAFGAFLQPNFGGLLIRGFEIGQRWTRADLFQFTAALALGRNIERSTSEEAHLKLNAHVDLVALALFASHPLSRIGIAYDHLLF